MKQKIFLISVLASLLLFLFTFDLDAWIASRIKGQVVDEATGEPLNEVTVRLYYIGEIECFPTKRTETGANGIYVFDNLKKGRYFLQFKKKGYVDLPNENAFLFLDNLSKVVNIIELGEGDIRFVHVKMKRGASVKGTVYLKDLSGLRAIRQEDPKEHPRVEVTLHRKVKDEEPDKYSEWTEYDRTLLEKDGTYFFNGLEPKNTFKIVFKYDGFFSHSEMLDVLKTESFEIDHIFDSTNKTGLSVKVFVNNEPRYAILKLRDLSDKEYLDSRLEEENDRFVLKNAEHGRYNLHVVVYSIDPAIYINKLVPIVIEDGKTVIMDLKF